MCRFLHASLLIWRERFTSNGQWAPRYIGGQHRDEIMEKMARSFEDELARVPIALNGRSHWSVSTLVVFFGGVGYLGTVMLTGGFTRSDANASMYSAVMFSHGHWSCAYRSIPNSQPLAGPVYSAVSGLAQWISHAGFSSSYLTSSQIGTDCQHAYASYLAFIGVGNGAGYESVLRTALVAWFALTLSGIAILRTTPLRSTRITWLIPLFFALTPPVIFCVQEYYHPQDLWALALAFAAVALTLRKYFFVAGVVWVLAIMSQPFALLGMVMTVVISSWTERRRLVGGGMLAAMLVCGAFYFAWGRRSVFAALFGTGDTFIHAGTWMAELKVGSIAGLVISRVGPIVGAALVAWWVRSRRPDVVQNPVILLGLLATVWSLRLVFEENLWGYYCMATGATLVLRDILARRASRGTIYWLLLVLFAFGNINPLPRPWGTWHYWVWQVMIVPSGFLVALFSLRETMNGPSRLRGFRSTTDLVN